jgi:hypothetical protein
MLFNIRPQTIAQLNAVLEEMPSRFSPEQQEEIVQVVTDVLGQYSGVAQTNGEETKED